MNNSSPHEGGSFQMILDKRIAQEVRKIDEWAQKHGRFNHEIQLLCFQQKMNIIHHDISRSKQFLLSLDFECPALSEHFKTPDLIEPISNTNTYVSLAQKLEQFLQLHLPNRIYAPEETISKIARKKGGNRKHTRPKRVRSVYFYFRG
jgi:hypothetical protein